ncbi:MAG: TRL-like family protein [Planctomycetota bacterium]
MVPPQGIVYSGISAPLDTDLNQTDLGNKRGASSSTAILGLVAWGDASASTAARAGGIGRIKHADYQYTNVLGIYQSFTTVVYGD